MLEKVRKYIEFHLMLEVGDKVVMGVSGGADSVCLFLLLQELREEYDLTLFVVHVHHGIRGVEADEDAEYVKLLCERYGVPFYLFKENIPKLARENGMSEEEAGRKYRYECFYQVMEQTGANKLATAHHMDDQAETVLFHLVRGTKLSGMTGISPINDKIIRPLLSCQKKEIISWLLERKFTWREDETNKDNHYTRNKLRNQVIPVLGEINEQAVSHIADFATYMTEYEKFFQKAVQKYMDEYVILEEESKQCKVNRIHLRQQERILAEAVLYEMLVFACGAKKDISKEHVEALYSQLYNQSGRKIMLPYQTEAEISYENLVIRKCFERTEPNVWEQNIPVKALIESKEELHFALPYGGNLTVRILNMVELEEEQREEILNAVLNSKNNYTKLFDCDTIRDTLHVRTPDSEDYFIMNDRGNRKKLSRYFIDSKVPLEERKYKIVVANGHEILWIIGGRRGETYKINNNTKYVLLLMYEGEKG